MLISPYLMHRDPAAWPEPQRFWPERWLVTSQEHDAAPQWRDGPSGRRGSGLHAALADMGPNGA